MIYHQLPLFGKLQKQGEVLIPVGWRWLGDVRNMVGSRVDRQLDTS